MNLQLNLDTLIQLVTLGAGLAWLIYSQKSSLAAQRVEIANLGNSVNKLTSAVEKLTDQNRDLVERVARLEGRTP